MKMSRLKLSLITAITLSSCHGPKQIVKTEREYVHDSVFIDKWHVREHQGDTIVMRDSIVVSRVRIERDTLRDTVMARESPRAKATGRELRQEKRKNWGRLVLALSLGFILGSVGKKRCVRE